MEYSNGIYKIAIPSASVGRAVQAVLFSYGCRWVSSGSDYVRLNQNSGILINGGEMSIITHHGWCVINAIEVDPLEIKSPPATKLDTYRIF